MANDFNLGQAMGDYEKSNADREFYLSMIQQGQTNRGAFMASPIAAYLAGVAGVKMANMKQQAVEAQQAINDEKQKKEDAQRAAEKALERRDNLYNNLYNIAQKARKGELAPSTAGAMGGYIVREMGGKPISFDVDNGLFDFELNGEEYQLDLNEGYTRKDIEEAKTEREREKAAAAKGRQERGIQGQKEVAELKSKLRGSGSGSGDATVSNRWQAFKYAYGPIIESTNQKNLLTEIQEYDDDIIEGFLADYDERYGIDKIYDIVKQEAKNRGLKIPNKKIYKEVSQLAELSDEDLLKNMPK